MRNCFKVLLLAHFCACANCFTILRATGAFVGRARTDTVTKENTKSLSITMLLSSASESANKGEKNPHVPNVLLVECGFGNDSHGQNATKAARRACRNAIEFNSISIKKIVPGGYDAMKLNVILAVPALYQNTLDLEEVASVFPYGDVKFTIQDGGMVAPSGRIIESLGDKNDDMLIVCAAVQVGY
mmetsp:Transcript_9363/g.14005  ORF Transcript_9363/g.14005 Transcript_9363/m.14005 type:complete len:186 (-) Transcript_9363:19-576(-)